MQTSQCIAPFFPLICSTTLTILLANSICDTKYLATCQGTEVGAASNLQTLSETLLKLPYPKISKQTSPLLSGRQ